MENKPDIAALAARRSVAVLCRKPAVLAAFDVDFARNLDAFAAFANSRPGTAVLLQLGYEHETPALAAELAATVARFSAAAPSARTIALANCENERLALEAAGVEARFIHQNCFLDERRYRPMGKERPYDAAYVARLTPCKRHELMPPGAKLLLMGCATKIYDSERDYADMVYSQYAAAKILPSFSGARISEYLALARCGLVLSAREGASFCSSEYFLCGLPVVDTPALGGRSALYPGDYVAYVESTREAVAEGIARWRDERPDPRKVREAWLDMAAPHREQFGRLMRELSGRPCGRPPHKLALRTPHPGAMHSLAIASYLAVRSLAVK
ncbi:MAG: hypothetical protein ILO34_03350 [Kiritimatiellae bacterium]|nr:hypothetical protein [Kiritimatiellia bacterium]